MPYTVRAMILPDPEGDYNVYVNDHLSDDAKEKAIAHELRHIQRNDTASEEDIKTIEEETKCG